MLFLPAYLLLASVPRLLVKQDNSTDIVSNSTTISSSTSLTSTSTTTSDTTTTTTSTTSTTTESSLTESTSSSSTTTPSSTSTGQELPTDTSDNSDESGDHLEDSGVDTGGSKRPQSISGSVKLLFLACIGLIMFLTLTKPGKGYLATAIIFVLQKSPFHVKQVSPREYQELRMNDLESGEESSRPETAQHGKASRNTSPMRSEIHTPVPPKANLADLSWDDGWDDGWGDNVSSKEGESRTAGSSPTKSGNGPIMKKD